MKLVSSPESRLFLFSAFHTQQRLPDKVPPTGLSYNPGPVLPWWIVSDVLAMTALQISDPVSFLILMKPDDASRDRGLLRLH